MYVRYAPWPFGRRLLAEAVNFNQRVKPHNFAVRTRFGYEMAGCTEDLIQRFIYLFGVWEPNLTYWIHERLRPGDTFVDVGSNVGYYALLAASCIGEKGHSIAIEASPSIFEILNHNLQRNDIGTRVRSVNVAASDHSGTAAVYAGPKANIGRTTTVPREDLQIEGTIIAKPLEDILTDEEIAGARLIKIDVEGLEGAVVRGLLPALQSCREDLEIIVEVNGQPAPEGESTSDIVGQLGERGFNVYEISNSYVPRHYVEAARAQQRPQRVHGAVKLDKEVDLIFSRIDADGL
jgi:FkbM family methyltransferase